MIFKFQLQPMQRNKTSVKATQQEEEPNKPPPPKSQEGEYIYYFSLAIFSENSVALAWYQRGIMWY